MKQYLFRIDDICKHTSINKLNKLIDIFIKYEVKPLISVIPDNKDKSIIDQDKENWLGTKMLWEKIKYLSNELDWPIGVHGLNHECVNIGKSILPSIKKGEFLGLDYETQDKMLKESLHYFQQNNIKPFCWVAPRHLFDAITLKALDKNNLRIISDGYWLYPVTLNKMIFLPQQIATPRKMPIGIWTFCSHLQTMGDTDFELLESFLKNNKNYLKSFELNFVHKYSFFKKIINALFNKILFIFRWLKVRF